MFKKKIKSKPKYKAVLFSCLLMLLSGCASINYRNGNAAYEEFGYAEATRKYEKIFEKPKYKDVQYNLADCYRNTGANEKAIALYSRLVKNKDCPNICKYYYAQELMKAGDYKNAKIWFESYSKGSSKQEPQINALAKSCDSLAILYRDSDLFKISILRFNASNINSFSPAYFKSGIVFVSDRYYASSKNVKSKWTGQKCFDLFYSKKTEAGNWLDPEPLAGNINGIYNEGPAVFNADNNVIYFSRNSMEDNKLTKNAKDVNVVKIYKGILENNEWNTVGELSFNSNDYSVAHPALSKDGNTIYFVSDMPWGYGGSDIYKVRYINGRWSKPENLGAEINTSGNEMFPFVIGDSMLYFSSDTRIGLGGLDIYLSELKDDKWGVAQNMGYPINTSSDDFGFITDDKRRTGFFTSNRGGKTDRIYSFIKLPPRLSVSGAITSYPKLDPLPNAKVQIKDDNGLDTTLTANASGYFFFRLDLDDVYHFRFYAKDYFAESYDISTFGKKASEEIDAPTALEAIILNIPKVNKKIVFEQKSLKLRKGNTKGLDELTELMNKNQQIIIELNAYTDSRGVDKDNLELTTQRADYCRNYLIQKGINPARIIAKGYGESKIINHCTNGITCIDEEHEENNRIEVVIVSTDFK